MISTFQLNLMKVMAQSDPHARLSFAVRRASGEAQRIIASGRMEEINTGLENGDYEVTWEKGSGHFKYYDTWGAGEVIIVS